MKKYKIWIPLYTFYCGYGGAEKQAEKLSLKLVEKGSEVNIITSNFLNKGRLIPEIEGFDHTLLPSFYTGNNKLLRKLNTFFFMIELFFFLVLNAKKYDVLKTFFVDKISAVVILAALITKKPVITLEANVRKMEEPIKNPVLKIIDNIFFEIYKKASAIVAISKEIEEEYINDFNVPPEKIHFIQNGVEIFPEKNKQELRKTLGLSEEKTYAVITARFGVAKNHVRLMHIWKLISEKNPQVMLLCLGHGGELMQQSKDFVRENNLKNNVIFKGSVDNVPDYLQAADIFVFPSTYEGMPNALAEAMSAGLPCAVSKIKAHELLLEHEKSGLLFDLTLSNDEIAKMILSLINNKEKQIELGKNAKKATATFSLDAIADKYYDLYEKLLFAGKR